MSGNVPVLSMVFMAVTCLVCIALPIALLIFLRKKKQADVLPFFVGCAVMLLFALVLERSVHGIVLATEGGKAMQQNVWLFALYGGFMAGLFEETGRLVAFKTVLKKYQAKDSNALMYGAGHGGFEAIALVGVTMINNITWSVLINSGNTEALTKGLEGDVLMQVQAAIEALKSTEPTMFLLGGVERIFAFSLHVALSVLVWFAAKKEGKLYLYPLAILIHMAVDSLTVIISGFGLNTYLLEAVVGLMCALSVLLAKKIWKYETA